MKDITQFIYDETFKTCLRFTNKVYRSLPGEVGYPFIYLGEQFDQPTETRDLLLSVGTTQIAIHLYGLADKRKQTTDLMRDLRLSLRFLHSDQYSVSGVIANILQENPNNTEPLIHGILTVNFSYYQDERKKK